MSARPGPAPVTADDPGRVAARPGGASWDRRAGGALLAVAAWTAYIWTVRAWNLAQAWAADPAPAVHATLTVVSLASAVVVGRIGWALLRRSRR